ncbi:hypothetical protein QCA50_005191 [Cerrena zonata]|uniref:H-type lectin domain-containing protein n=1 Tax=Cerrena zonata TaxID=2478898 RepID=A0AAW0GNH6_9APHY
MTSNKQSGAMIQLGALNRHQLLFWPQWRTLSGTIRFNSFGDTPPKMLLGINNLNSEIARIRYSLLNVTSSTADVALESWEDIRLDCGGCSWLSIPRDDLSIQCGRFDTLEDHVMARPQKLTERWVDFPVPYSDQDPIPNVVVWFESIYADPAHDCCIDVKPTRICHTGFNLSIDTWSDTNLVCATAAWLAYSGKRKDISSGTFSTDDVCPNQSHFRHSSYVPFAGCDFLQRPQVFTALNMLNISKEKDVRIKLYTSNVSMSGMTWNIDNYDDTILYGAGGVFIACIVPKSVGPADKNSVHTAELGRVKELHREDAVTRLMSILSWPVGKLNSITRRFKGKRGHPL